MLPPRARAAAGAARVFAGLTFGMAQAPSPGGGGAVCTDAESLAFFDERVCWQVAQFQGALDDVEARAQRRMRCHGHRLRMPCWQT